MHLLMQENNDPFEQFVLNCLSIHKGGLEAKNGVAVSAFLFLSHSRGSEVKTQWSLFWGGVFRKRDALTSPSCHVGGKLVFGKLALIMRLCNPPHGALPLELKCKGFGMRGSCLEIFLWDL